MTKKENKKIQVLNKLIEELHSIESAYEEPKPKLQRIQVWVNNVANILRYLQMTNELNTWNAEKVKWLTDGVDENNYRDYKYSMKNLLDTFVDQLDHVDELIIDPNNETGVRDVTTTKPQRPEQPKYTDPLDQWFDYYHVCNRLSFKFTLENIAENTKYSPGYIRNKHSMYKAERGIK